MQYITYEEYKSMGGTLDLTAFERNIDRACAIIDLHTLGRVKKMREITLKIKACCRDLVEYLYNHNSTEKVVTSKSQSAGAVSESVSYADFSVEIAEKETENIVYTYLATETDDYFTPILYRGAMR
jgi:hypothetical protein